MRRVPWAVNLSLVLVLAAAGGAQATCGIGNKIWEGRDGTLPMLAAFTTNVWTFKGISTTFEIAGCTEADNWFASDTGAKTRHYANNNFDRLAQDMARGQGEHLGAFTQLLRIGDQDSRYFRSFTQRNVPVLLPDDHVTADEMLDTLVQLMVEDERLSVYLQKS